MIWQYLPVFEIVDKGAAELLLDGLLCFVQKTFDGRVSDGECDDATCWQRAEQLGEPPAVVAGLVRVVALGKEHGGRVLIHHAQVDASAEVPLEGVTPRGEARGRDAPGQQGPGNSFGAVELQRSATHDADELAAQARDLRDRFVVGAAHEDDGGLGAVATFGCANVKGSAVLDENVPRSQGDVFRAVSVVCKNYLACNSQKKTNVSSYTRYITSN